MQDVYLIDASIYVFRSYYASDSNYIAKNGEPINAVYGFTRFLTQFLHQTKARHIACCFDESLATSFRNEIEPSYKANREPAPEDLKRQFKLCQSVADVLGVKTYADGYYEADDLIGTLAEHHKQKGCRIHIVSADKDLAQLVEKDDTWWSYGKDKALDADEITKKFGVYPHQIADFLALTGDSVDNIKGVTGIGKKTAQYLLNHFKTLDEVLKRYKEIQFLSLRGAKTCQKNIAKYGNNASLAKKLTTIKTDVPLSEYTVERRELSHTRINGLLDYLQVGQLLRNRILDLGKNL